MSNSVKPLRTKLDSSFDHIFALGCTGEQMGCYQHFAINVKYVKYLRCKAPQHLS